MPALFGLLLAAGAALAENPVPFVNQPLVPGAAVPGGPAFTLTVNGGMFVSGATVKWNGQPLSTTFVSQSQLTASVPASDIATASTVSITVTNPGTPVASNVVFFQVTTPESMVYYQDAPGYPTGATQPGAPAVAGNAMVAGRFLASAGDDLAFPTGGGADPPADDGLALLSGNGDGTFRTLPLQVFSVGGTGIAAGDFNGDGDLDLAVTSESLNTVTILLNDGDGTFTQAPGSPIAVGAGPSRMAVGDFNRDGKLDLAVLNTGLSQGGQTLPSSLTILLGNGDGTFKQAPGSPIPDSSLLGGAYAITVGDFNGDGVLDLAGTTYGVNVWAFLGNGDGTFRDAPVDPIPVPDLYYTEAISAGDFDGDGKLDLAISGDSHSHAVNILLGKGDGTFTAVADCCGFGDGHTYNDFMGMGDINGDGKPDLAVLTMANTFPKAASFIQLLLGKGDGTFQPTDYSVWMNPFPYGLAESDFDESGRLALAVIAYGPQAIWSFVQVPPAAWPHPPPDFTVTAQNSSLSVSAGGTVTDQITISSQYGFYGELTGETCAGVPAQATCTFSPPVPPAVTPDMLWPLESLYYTVSIATTAPQAASLPAFPAGPGGTPNRWPMALWAAFIALAMALAVVFSHAKARLARALMLAAVLICLSGWSSCGGSGPVQFTPAPPVGGTPPGNYTITVTASSPSGGGLEHSVPITLTVQ